MSKVGYRIAIAVLWFIDTFFYKPRRAIDLSILWPSVKRRCEEHYGSGYMNHARAIFAIHVFRDPAWMTRYTEDELHEIIEELD